MTTLRFINYIVSVLFVVVYTYQVIYILVSLFKKKQHEIKPVVLNKFAVLICARNEENVIGDLIDSIHAQTYDQDFIDIFVMADNCTDDTALIAQEKGAHVYRRFNQTEIGKGYALKELRKHINRDFPEGFDGYFVFDADNLLAPDYIEQMNRTFSEGHDIITSYRNSKNYGDNWISAGYALWFLRESRYLNNARHLIGTSCAVSGTGFMFSRKIADELGDWPFHLLTEDIEFSVNQIIQGRKIAYCGNAELFDEQPVKFSQSCRQRMRWAKGYIQVFQKYWKELIGGMFKGNFSCFDMSMNLMPAFILSAVSIFSSIILTVIGIASGEDISIALWSYIEMAGNMYATLFAIGMLTTITEWKHIRCSGFKKILYMFTFPIFLFTYIPISYVAFFKKCEWKPIEHGVRSGNLVRSSWRRTS